MRFLKVRLLVVTAHPDDESFLAGGMLVKNHEAGGMNFVFCATLGERGTLHLKQTTTATKLKRIRKQELLAAAKVLGVSKISLGGVPDGGVRNHQPVFFKKLTAFTKRIKPEVIIGFGRDGITGHQDHIASGSVAKRLAKKFHLPYLAFCMPPQLQKNQVRLKNRRKRGVYENTPPRESPDIIMIIDGKKKLRALRLHASQLKQNDPFWGLPRSVANAHLRAEYFAYHPWNAIRDRRPGAHR